MEFGFIGTEWISPHTPPEKLPKEIVWDCCDAPADSTGCKDDHHHPYRPGRHNELVTADEAIAKVVEKWNKEVGDAPMRKPRKRKT